VIDQGSWQVASSTSELGGVPGAMEVRYQRSNMQEVSLYVVLSRRDGGPPRVDVSSPSQGTRRRPPHR
jgi:hypothetical protein